MFCQPLLFVSGALALSGTLASATKIVGRDNVQSFQLWIYGPDPLGGYPVVYNDGFAYAVRPDIVDSNKNFVNITCKTVMYRSEASF
ncbi:hypothetical protein MBLNU459_g5438t1 [Dothideomycetes sp. NU459]